MDYLTVYLEILTVTLVLCIVLFLNVRSEMGNAWEVNIFRAVVGTLILALPADALTQAQYRGYMHMSPALVGFLYAFYMFMFSGVLPFLWFVFAELRLGRGLLRSRAALTISIIPLAIMSVACFASIKTGWFFEIDSFGIYTRGQYWSLQILVTYCYFLFTTVHAFIVASKETSSLQKRQHYMLATFVIAPFIGGLLQLFIGNHPFVAPATSLAMLFIFINIQGSLIHNDSLTGLFNRKSAEKYIEELKTQVGPGRPFHVFKIGIEGFKEINDAYDYTEGDKVLKLVAGVLQRVSNKYSGHVSRLGGVEFLAVINSNKDDLKETYEKAVTDAMAKAVKKEKLPYELKLDFGYAICEDPDVRTSTLMNVADREMHQNNNQ